MNIKKEEPKERLPTCEKCWSDASGIKSKYNELLEQREREKNTCSPEDQAGPNAKLCPTCKRKTCHQLYHICMSCGYQKQVEPKRINQ